MAIGYVSGCVEIRRTNNLKEVLFTSKHNGSKVEQIVMPSSHRFANVCVRYEDGEIIN
jgi:hypothetical protein